MTLRSMKPLDMHEISDVFKCLAEPNRVKLFLAILEEDPMTSTQLANFCDINSNTTFAHLRILRRQDLVEHLVIRKKGIKEYLFYTPTPFGKNQVAPFLEQILNASELPNITPRDCLTQEYILETINLLRFPYSSKPKKFRRTEKFFIDWLKQDMTTKDVSKALRRIDGLKVTNEMIASYHKMLKQLANMFGHYAREEMDTERRWRPIEEKIKNNNH